MNFGVYSLHLFFAALLQASAIKAAHIPKEEDKSKNEVIPFIEVYTKSMCQTRNVLVDILQEYPDKIEYTYIPSCVELERCAGCCSDEAFECIPTVTDVVTMQVMSVKQHVTKHHEHLNFTIHKQCECRKKQEVKTKKENHCEPCTERRKRLYVQDPLTCKCSCKITQLQCRSRQLELNERTCRCDKPRR